MSITMKSIEHGIFQGPLMPTAKSPRTDSMAIRERVDTFYLVVHRLFMKTSLEHLPEQKRQELQRAIEIIR